MKVWTVVGMKDGKPDLRSAEIIGRKGSWYTFRNMLGDEWKENGRCRWSDSALDAFQRFVFVKMCQARQLGWEAGAERLKTQADYLTNEQLMKQDVEAAQAIIVEAFKWGKLLGKVEASTKKENPCPSAPH